MTWRAALGAAIVASLGCERAPPGPHADAPPAANAALGGDVAARVGTSAIPISVVASVAEAQRISAREAAQKVIDDEILASAARALGLDRRLPASSRLVSARGRFTSDRLLDEAKRRGPPNDDEVKALSEKHWLEVDRPPAAHTIHAIVIMPKDASLKPLAQKLAERVQAAVRGASEEGFEAAAKAASSTLIGSPAEGKLEIRVERLPAFTEAGRVTEGGGRMDERFAKATFRLSSVGDTSGVVETGFGWHVIRLLERLPEKRMPLEQRRLAFADEVYSQRTRDLLAARLRALRSGREVTVSPAAEQLMRSAAVDRKAVEDP